ncbi:MAG TPA: nuclear transport factor 2 family protein [Pseudolysinimonas sp.]|nr:nuclear transport factor 2 family protein [Pseudolysinimonas sp.]
MTDNIPETCRPAWAHDAGIIDLQPVAEVPTDLTAIADRLLILETVARYAIAYDERRLDVLSDLYTETGTYSYSIGGAPADGRSGREVLIPWYDEIMRSQVDQRRHMLGSVVIEELTSDRALVIAYKTIYGIEKTVRLVTTGLYRITLVKQNKRWLIEDAFDALDRPF